MSKKSIEGKFSIQSVFHEVQFSKSSHASYKKILTNIYNKSNITDFLPEFIKCLKVCILHEEKSANVERTLDFTADFAVSFSFDLTEDETCPLLEGVFSFIFENHDCITQLVRLRVCQLMNRLLDNMGHDASVVEETYNKIAECMLVRLQDSMSSVRTQAVYALYRLQSPGDPNCEIINAFVFHMTHDPCHEVRRAVVQKIAVNKMTLAHVLTRMNDVKDTVRKEAYIVIGRFVIRQFTIKQRQLILENGLGDRSELIRDYVKTSLIPSWLKYFNHNYQEFLECIHVEKIVDTSMKLLKAVFGKQHEVILEAKAKEMHIINQKIAYHKLTMVTVVFWRALVEFCKPTDESDKWERVFQVILPDLTPFCQYIRGYYFPQTPVEEISSNRSSMESASGGTANNDTNREGENTDVTTNVNSSSTEENKESPAQNEGNTTADKKKPKNPHTPDENVLVHLLEMCRVFDLSDEMGRTSLKQLCKDLLESTSVTLVSVPTLSRLLDHIVPSPTAKLSAIAEIITELREPLMACNASVYVPDLILIEAEEKKSELEDRINELKSEMEIAEELGDVERMEEIKGTIKGLQEELKILNTVTPHEPGRNINNDPETLKKCLTILVEIMKQGKIRKLDPTLLSLMQNFIVPTLNLRIEGDGSTAIKNLAMEVLATFCILDVELAKEHFFMFCFNIATDSMSVTALKSVFDLLHVHGLNTFNITDPDEANTAENVEEETPKKPNLINLLFSLLTSESKDMRRTAVVGLCKLLFFGRIKSAELVSKLILLWYNPEVETDPWIRQPLGVFFRMFAAACPHAPELLLRAFLPTVRELFHIEVTDPMSEVVVESVANLMVDLTRPGTSKYEKKDLHVHNQLAINICEAVLSQEFEPINAAVLVKLLGHLDLSYDNKTDMSILSALASRMVATIPKGDKLLLRLAAKFEVTLQVRQDANQTASTINNTLPAESSTATGTVSRMSILFPDDNSNSEVEEEEDAENLSQDLTVSRAVDESDIVIPDSDESSDTDTEESTSLRSPKKKLPRISDDSEFKQPLAPAPRTPAKTPFKVPTKTPRKTSKTPAKTPSKSTTKTPGKTLAKTASTTPSKPSKTPSKRASKTPAKTTKTNTKTTANGRLSSSSSEEGTPPKSPRKSPKSSPSEVSVSTSERATRSTRKQKL
ncbi:condensin complex subunit 3 isoform X2 [Macrosteles quadrilineatus]|uniref:condensin complex subunit 3 isoform X2 n=1 Tax=Macrosteles quadrilineatus TaxID=74068 RepID=UPI0023E337F1|nr:condensin complex subunit 3 isoform X2 [Macrosteles quadrilineatus]